MRLWSLHPMLLDSKGLVALWREGLLAQKVLKGETTGYRNHPQLLRFKEHPKPLGAIGTYLAAVSIEAKLRNYNFDASKIVRARTRRLIAVSDDQLAYEWRHLRLKLIKRAPDWLATIEIGGYVPMNGLFHLVGGPIADWERITMHQETT